MDVKSRIFDKKSSDFVVQVMSDFKNSEGIELQMEDILKFINTGNFSPELITMIDAGMKVMQKTRIDA